MTDTTTITYATCKECNINFEATTANFYMNKNKLRTAMCKKCKSKQIYANSKKKGHCYNSNKEYYNAYMKAYNKKIVSCECGSTISRGRYDNHKKTNLHARRMLVKEEESRKVSSPSLPSS